MAERSRTQVWVSRLKEFIGQELGFSLHNHNADVPYRPVNYQPISPQQAVIEWSGVIVRSVSDTGLVRVEAVSGGLIMEVHVVDIICIVIPPQSSSL